MSRYPDWLSGTLRPSATVRAAPPSVFDNRRTGGIRAKSRWPMTTSGRRFGEDERGIAEETAVNLALVIDNASLYENAQRAVRSRDAAGLQDVRTIIALLKQKVFDRFSFWLEEEVQYVGFPD